MLPYTLIFLNITQHPDTSFHRYLVVKIGSFRSGAYPG